MPRSGHHAVANWIESMCEGDTTLLSWGKEKCVQVDLDLKPITKTTIICFEMHTIYEVLGLTAHFKTDNRHIILVTRDYKNWAASCYKYGLDDGARRRVKKGHRVINSEISETMLTNITKMSTLWEAQVEQAAGKDVTHIWFDRWFSNTLHRIHLATHLDLEYEDSSLKEVAFQGGGSSFDAQKYNGCAQKMPVLDRWKNFVDDPYFKKLLTLHMDLTEISDEALQ